MTRPRPRDWYVFKMTQLREARGGRCAMCPGREILGLPESLGEHLEFAHLRPTRLCGRGRGLPNRYHDVMRHPDRYVLVCRDCHAALDGRGGRIRRRTR